MGLRLTTGENVTAMFDSVTGWAFGPTFDTSEDAQAFLEWADAAGYEDLRTYDNSALEHIYSTWIKERREVGEDV